MELLRDFFKTNFGDLCKTLLLCSAVAFLITAFKNELEHAWTVYFSSYVYGLCIHSCVFLTQKYISRKSIVISYLIPASIGFGLATMVIQTFFGIFFSSIASDLSSWLFFALLANVVALLWLYIVEQKNIVTEELKQTKLAQVITEKNLAESKLKVLQAQIEPHFLFNTIANIKACIHIDPEKASLIIDNLSTLLRHSLKRSQEDKATLRDELELCRSYLEIQAIRLGDRFDFSLNIDEAVNIDMEFPTLLIQPLIENAVVHGVESLVRPCEIRTRVFLSNENTLTICVRDNGVGLGNSVHAGQGIGLDNIRQRLAIYAENEASVTIRRCDNEWTEASVTMQTG